eukprot:12498912-Alexandrium_andersonii.AAC.1
MFAYAGLPLLRVWTRTPVRRFRALPRGLPSSDSKPGVCRKFRVEPQGSGVTARGPAILRNSRVQPPIADSVAGLPEHRLR